MLKLCPLSPPPPTPKDVLWKKRVRERERDIPFLQCDNGGKKKVYSVGKSSSSFECWSWRRWVREGGRGCMCLHEVWYGELLHVKSPLGSANAYKCMQMGGKSYARILEWCVCVCALLYIFHSFTTRFYSVLTGYFERILFPPTPLLALPLHFPSPLLLDRLFQFKNGSGIYW